MMAYKFVLYLFARMLGIYKLCFITKLTQKWSKFPLDTLKKKN